MLLKKEAVKIVSHSLFHLYYTYLRSALYIPSAVIYCTFSNIDSLFSSKNGTLVVSLPTGSLNCNS